MKLILTILGTFFLTLNLGYSQGRIQLALARAPTHVGSVNGPLAGRGIWGQFILGENLDDLKPIADPVEHFANGVFHEFQAVVPDIPPWTLVYVQFLAWDGTVWGTEFNLVPEDQFGRTDAVPYQLGHDFSPLGVPQFTQSAVVPPIPEPSTWLLVILGIATLSVFGGGRTLGCRLGDRR